MLASIRVTKAGHFLDAIMYISTKSTLKVFGLNPSHGLNMVDHIMHLLFLWA